MNETHLICPRCSYSLLEAQDLRITGWCGVCGWKGLPVHLLPKSIILSQSTAYLGSTTDYIWLKSDAGRIIRLQEPWQEQKIFELTEPWALKGIAFSSKTSIISPNEPNAVGTPKPFIGFDIDTGNILWQVNTDGFLWTAPVADDTFACAVDNQGVVAVVNPSTGQPVWDKGVELGDYPHKGVTPHLTNNLLLLVSPKKYHGSLLAYSRRNGKPIWEFQPQSGCIDFQPASDTENVYVCAGKGLYSITLSTGEGKMIYQVPRESGRGWFFAPAIVTPRGLLVVNADFDEDGKPAYALQMLNSQSGQSIWKHIVTRHPYFAPAYRNDIVYFVDRQGYLLIIDLENGELLEKLPLEKEEPASVPILMQDDLFLLTKSGKLLHFTSKVTLEQYSESPQEYLRRGDWESSAIVHVLSGDLISAKQILQMRSEDHAKRLLSEVEHIMADKSTTHRPLRVFISYTSADKDQAIKLYRRLITKGIDAWIDSEQLLPGQDWKLEIDKALYGSDAIIICISNRSVTKEGYVQKELKHALDLADEKPEGTIFLIPVRLEECQVPFRLKNIQWVDLYAKDGFSRLEKALSARTHKLKS